jgi:outer membrane protein assembly factor BamB
MSNYNEPVVFNCPNCGSSISMQGDAGTCAYCGTAVERPRKTGRVASGATSWSVAPTTYPTGTPYRPRRGVHPLLTLLLMFVTGVSGFIFGRALPAGAPLGLGAPSSLVSATSIAAPIQPLLKTAAAIASVEGGSVSEIAAALPRDGKGSDLIAYVYHSGDSRYTIALIDGGSHTPRWQSPMLSKEAYQGLLAVGDDRVYFSDKDQLFALSLRDGSQLWQAALTVEPSSGCEGCLRAVAGQVAVLEKDGSLQVFGGQDGKLAWETRLAKRPSKLQVAGDRLVIVDEQDKPERTTINFLDPRTGKPALQLEPICPPSPDINHEERPDSNSAMLFSADGKTMFIGYGFFTQCAQAWDLTTGKKLWETPLERDFSFGSWSVQANGSIFGGDGKLLWALDTATGKTRTVVTEKEYQLKPLALAGKTLIARAAPDWDSQRQELWGFDSATGERRWQIKLQAHDLLEGNSSGDWQARVTPAGLLVVQALADEPRLAVDVFNTDTGASLLHQESPLGSIGTPSLYGAVWGDDMAWFRIGGDMYAIDLANGNVAYKLN